MAFNRYPTTRKMNDPYIPPKTQARMNTHHPVGTRHAEAIKVAISLLGNGMAPEAVYAQLRVMFESDVSDKELWDIVNGARSKNPTPSGFGKTPVNQPWRTPGATARQPAQISPSEKVKWWLSGEELTEEQLIATSPVSVPHGTKEQTLVFFDLVYAPLELINIVTGFTVTEGKANPQGSGKILTREKWVEWFNEKGIPGRDAGAWVRPNPCKEKGSGKDGAITDADVTRFRFLLIESDNLSMGEQLALYSKLKLPIEAILSSGGKSVHAWVQLDSPDMETYRETAGRILASLKPFGIDEANKNPSRLSRLVGATRQIGASNGGHQRLLYLNPTPAKFTQESLIAFEESLKIPALQDYPLEQLIRDSINRYDELCQNQGKLGVQTGITEFDAESGGLKPGNFVVIAGETGGGKSTLALNWINNAIQNGVGVAFFSLEMDRDEIIDFLVSMNCSINRNVFNTGKFEERDLLKMTMGMAKIKKLPLWIFDSALTSVEDVRIAVTQLKAEKKIGLVVVDYIQLVVPFNPMEIREQQVAGIAQGLRAIAKEQKIPMVALSQLNEEGKLRESRVIAHVSNIMVMIDSLTNDPKMRVVKGRRIQCKSYELNFDAQYCRLSSRGKFFGRDIPKQKDEDAVFI